MPTSLPPLVKAQLETLLGAAITAARPLSGGDTSAALLLQSARGPFVVKLQRERGQTAPPPQQFFAEAQGLALLRGAGVRVPDVLGYGLTPAGPADAWAYLLLSYLPPVPATPQAHEALGLALAALHRVSAAQFGGTPDNFMGALPQTNPALPSAAQFFWDARLAPQVQRATSLGPFERRGFEALRERLPRLIPAEPPALIHGDLWQGNVLHTAAGPALIDPAPTYFHREADLSMLRLFGGTDERVFAAYAEAFAPAAGWQERAALWNLYPLLVHLNLFGTGYLARVQQALSAALVL